MSADKYSRRPVDTAPARPIAWAAQLALMIGGPVAALGWLVFGFGMIFVWTFGTAADLEQWRAFRGPLVEVPGVVVSTESTPYRENDSPVFRITFEFTTHQGRVLQAESWATAWRPGVGETVVVEVSQTDPPFARIKDARSAPFGAWTILVGLVPLAGLVVVAVACALRLRTLRILRRGRLVTGVLAARNSTNVQINRQLVDELVFAYQDANDATQQARLRTHHVPGLAVGATADLFVDPRNPGAARLVMLLPQWLGLGEQQGRPGLALLRAAVIPMLAVLPHALAAWLIYG